MSRIAKKNWLLQTSRRNGQGSYKDHPLRYPCLHLQAATLKGSRIIQKSSIVGTSKNTRRQPQDAYLPSHPSIPLSRPHPAPPSYLPPNTLTTHLFSLPKLLPPPISNPHAFSSISSPASNHPHHLPAPGHRLRHLRRGLGSGDADTARGAGEGAES